MKIFLQFDDENFMYKIKKYNLQKHSALSLEIFRNKKFVAETLLVSVNTSHLKG